jgi:hypothetical protein
MSEVFVEDYREDSRGFRSGFYGLGDDLIGKYSVLGCMVLQAHYPNSKIWICYNEKPLRCFGVVEVDVDFVFKMDIDVNLNIIDVKMIFRRIE